MNKSIVIIDTPKSCDECPFQDDYWYCLPEKAKGYVAFCESTEGRQKWCPLKPVPHELQADWYTDGYKEGFNACLEELGIKEMKDESIQE